MICADYNVYYSLIKSFLITRIIKRSNIPCLSEFLLERSLYAVGSNTFMRCWLEGSVVDSCCYGGQDVVFLIGKYLPDTSN